MIRTLVILAAITVLASCEQYREPEANCFTFHASVVPGEPDCIFTPLERPEDSVEV